jgi:hypothetical protein
MVALVDSLRAFTGMGKTLGIVMRPIVMEME